MNEKLVLLRGQGPDAIGEPVTIATLIVTGIVALTGAAATITSAIIASKTSEKQLSYQKAATQTAAQSQLAAVQKQALSMAGFQNMIIPGLIVAGAYYMTRGKNA